MKNVIQSLKDSHERFTQRYVAAADYETMEYYNKKLRDLEHALYILTGDTLYKEENEDRKIS